MDKENSKHVFTVKTAQMYIKKQKLASIVMTREVSTLIMKSLPAIASVSLT